MCAFGPAAAIVSFFLAEYPVLGMETSYLRSLSAGILLHRCQQHVEMCLVSLATGLRHISRLELGMVFCCQGTIGTLALTATPQRPYCDSLEKTSGPKTKRMLSPWSGCSALTGWGHSNNQMFMLNCIGITHKITRTFYCHCCLFLFFCCWPTVGYCENRNQSFLCWEPREVKVFAFKAWRRS